MMTVYEKMKAVTVIQYATHKRQYFSPLFAKVKKWKTKEDRNGVTNGRKIQCWVS